MAQRWAGSRMKTVGFRDLLLLLTVILCAVCTGAVGTRRTKHLKHALGRAFLQADEDPETGPPCDQESQNMSEDCETGAPEKALQPNMADKGSDDDGQKDAIVSAAAVAAVLAFIGAVTLILGYIYYRKDPEKFRSRCWKGRSLLPSPRSKRQFVVAQQAPPGQPRQLSLGQPSPLAQVVPQMPTASSEEAVTYGQPRKPDPMSMPLGVSLTTTSPSTHSGREPVGTGRSTVVDSGFVLPSTVKQVPGPRTVPPPILAFDADRHPAPPPQGPHPFPLPQYQVDVSRLGQSGVYSFGYPRTGLSDTIATTVQSQASQHSQQASTEPEERLAPGPGQAVGNGRPPRSPFDPEDSTGSSQWDYERRSAVGLYPPPAHANRDEADMGASSAQQLDHSGLITIPEQSCPDLNYDIRVLPLSERPTALGKGAFGTVEPGVFTDSGGNIVHVAVKYGTELFYSKSPKEVLQIFQSELDVMCRVPAHANIVRCYGGRVRFDNEDSIGERDVYIVEELMHANLQDVIHGDDFSGGLPYKLILKIALHIATGLEHLHRSGVLHYDLKPANILVDEDFNAKIADFGASKVKANSYISGTGFRGTLGYMAPELMLGAYVRHIPINEKIDVYSFGVVLWEMVERQYPPNPLSAGAQNADGVDQEPMPVVDDGRFQLSRRCPKGLRDLIQECVNLAPAKRPKASEVRERVEELIAQSQHRTDLNTNVDG